MRDYSIPIHHSLTRPQLLLGCDRELYLALVMTCGLLAGPAGIMKSHPPGIICGLLLWLTGQIGLSQMAKRDPMQRQVFIRSLNYKDFYPAVSPIPDKTKPEYRRW